MWSLTIDCGRPGERVPVDGVLLEGTTTVDESMVTGEPIPVEKTQDAKVTGGTVNGTGAFIMRAERVTKAQRSRAPIQRLADTVAGCDDVQLRVGHRRRPSAKTGIVVSATQVSRRRKIQYSDTLIRPLRPAGK